MDITAIADDIAEDFVFLGDWEERYGHIIALGRANGDMPDSACIPENRVGNCASQVWLDSKVDSSGRVWFRGKSDALIVSGLIAILLKIFSGQPACDILRFDAEAFFCRIGIDGALTAQRANGLRAMLERMRSLAAAATTADSPHANR